jgi:hypothetical protein
MNNHPPDRRKPRPDDNNAGDRAKLQNQQIYFTMTTFVRDTVLAAALGWALAWLHSQYLEGMSGQSGPGAPAAEVSHD